MQVEVIIPKLSLAMEEGNLVRWLKQEGDTVQAGEAIFEVETDKAIMEVTAPVGGVISAILFEEGTTLPVATVVAYITNPETKLDFPNIPTGAPDASGMVPPAAISPNNIGGSPDSNPPIPENRTNIRDRNPISWRARHRAKEQGIDTSLLPPGSGPGGRIVEKDVMRVIAAQTTTDAVRACPISLTVEVPVSGLLSLIKRLKPYIEQDSTIQLCMTDLYICLTAVLLRRHPKLYSHPGASHVDHQKELNIHLAVLTPGGIAYPVLHLPEGLNLGTIATWRADLTEQGRTGNLMAEEWGGDTFTLFDLGELPVDICQNPMQTSHGAVLTIGRVKERVYCMDGTANVVPTAFFTLLCNPQLVDMATAAAFFDDLVSVVDNPEMMLAWSF